jgi:hypothetical protein
MDRSTVNPHEESAAFQLGEIAPERGRGSIDAALQLMELQSLAL